MKKDPIQLRTGSFSLTTFKAMVSLLIAKLLISQNLGWIAKRCPNGLR